MLSIDLAQIKENIAIGVVKVVKWIDSKEQLAIRLTRQFKQKSNNRRGEEIERVRELELVCSC